MNWSLIRLICLLSGITVSQSSVLASEKVTLGLLVFPPVIVIDAETGRCVGEAIEVTKLALKKFDLDIVCAPPARLYRLIEQGTVDVTINIKSTLAIKDKVLFTNIPYQNLHLNLYARAGKANTVGTVSAIRSFDYSGFRVSLSEQGFEFIDLPTSTDAIRMFTRGRSDFLLSYSTPAEFLIDEFPEDYVVKELQSFPTFYAVNKASPERHVILEQLNNVAETLSLSTFDEILAYTILRE